MTDLAKILITAGALLLVAGGILLVASRHLHLGKLPGDIFIQKGHFSFTFPLTTSVVVSIILSVVLILCSRK